MHILSNVQVILRHISLPVANGNNLELHFHPRYEGIIICNNYDNHKSRTWFYLATVVVKTAKNTDRLTETKTINLVVVHDFLKSNHSAKIK